MKTKRLNDIGASWLKAKCLANGEYVYFDSEWRKYWVVPAEDVFELGLLFDASPIFDCLPSLVESGRVSNDMMAELLGSLVRIYEAWRNDLSTAREATREERAQWKA